ncbi:MAG: zf-HC2 domain-containing protein [Eubacteriales bacterium]|nr:zf-HC2 domain-containing protein [Eubacteriales bacterium]
MECSKAEGMVTRYINRTLTLKEQEEFLQHIENCSSCYDELETYFIVQQAMQQLDDEDEETVMDFRRLLEQDLKRSRRDVIRKKVCRCILAVLGCLVLGFLAAFLIFVVMEVFQLL